MIVEKRKQIRKIITSELDPLVTFKFFAPNYWEDESVKENETNIVELNLPVLFNFNGSSDWGDELVKENKTTPWLIVLAFALLPGISAYAVGSYFFWILFQ